MLIANDKKIKQQHETVRNAAGWYDFTHRLLEVTGPDATIFLEKLFVNNIGNAGLGRAKYTTMLNEDGLILDDVIVFRFEENKYWVSTLFINRLIEWFNAQKESYNVSYKDITLEWNMFSIQGPKSRDLVNAIAKEKIDDLKFFEIKSNKIDDIDVKIARSGYTGEKLGYEVYISSNYANILEDKLSKHESEFGAMHITEIDVMVLTLPAEKGMVLMLDVWKTNPFEVDLEGSIDWNKDFIGKEALLKIKKAGPSRKLLGFEVEEFQSKLGGPLIYGGPHGAHVMKNGERIGKVTKYTYGFTYGKNIGNALVDLNKIDIGDTVEINGVETILRDRKFVP